MPAIGQRTSNATATGARYPTIRDSIHNGQMATHGSREGQTASPHGSTTHMSFVRLQHIGVVVRDLQVVCDQLDSWFGLRAQDFRDDQGHGMQLDARILLGNECWLHLVQNWDPDSRVTQFLQQRGEGLEHIAIETDDIDADVAHLRSIGVPVFEDQIFHAADGYEAFVFPDQLPGMTVELIQGHETSWTYPQEAIGLAVSRCLGISRLRHLGLVVSNRQQACERFERLFRLPAHVQRRPAELASNSAGPRQEAHIPFDNDCTLHLVHDPDPTSRAGKFLRERGEGLDRLILETRDLDADLAHLRKVGAPTSDLNNGRSVVVSAAELAGLTIELFEPDALD